MATVIVGSHDAVLFPEDVGLSATMACGVVDSVTGLVMVNWLIGIPVEVTTPTS